jgi:F-type H+-transporting ATPase subunit epsilon
MAVFKFELVSPERLVLAADVDAVIVPGAAGDMTVMANHAPLMTSLRVGVVTAKGAGPDKRVFVRGGFAEMGAAGLTILAETATPLEELDRARLEREIKDAEEDVADAKDEAARHRATEKLAQLRDVAAAV